MNEVFIGDLDKADVLAALYNRAIPLGEGFLEYRPAPLSSAELQKWIDEGQPFVGYLYGRVLKVDLSGQSFDSTMYDQDNGPEAAQEAIDSLRATGDPNSIAIHAAHVAGILRSA